MDFIGHETTKIPTLLGLSLLVTALFLGMFIYLYRQNIIASQKTLYTPSEIEVTNINSSQATITWWSDTPTIGQIAYGKGLFLDQMQNDNRDLQNITPHQVHFVTLRNLQPETTYQYQVVSNDFRFPNQPHSFTTAKTLEETSQNRPLRGSVLNVNLNPIDEALVFIKIKNAAQMTTFTSTAGNFIIPLKELRTTDLSAPFPINSTTPATLVIKKGKLQSEIEINLPLDDSQLLPPLTIGQNINLKDLLAQVTPSPKPGSNTLSASYDLNSDGKTNSLDLAIITQNSGKKVSDITDEKIKQADLNRDGTIDKKDSDLLLTTL